MMKEREREREKRLSPLLFRLPESRTDEQSSGALKGQRPGPTGALRVSLFFSSLYVVLLMYFLHLQSNHRQFVFLILILFPFLIIFCQS